MDIIERDSYLERLSKSRGNGLIKIICGIRRCGKSFLLFRIFRKFLLEDGIPESHIISLQLDDLANSEFLDPHKLLSYIKEHVSDDGRYYILLDEIQMTENFTAVLNSLTHIDNADVYVTGSNSRFLSSDIATEFRGRGEVILLHPLSFSEFHSVRGGNLDEEWEQYIRYGGLPLVALLEDDRKRVEYLQTLYKTLYLRDIIERNKIRKVDEFDRLSQIIASSIGSPCNPNKLANTFRSAGAGSLSVDTISAFLDNLQDAFVVEKSLRYDIKGRRYIGTLPKYYFTDTGIRNAIIGFRQQEESHLMENVVYNELRGRGFMVDIGAIESRSPDGSTRNYLEVDFVANLGSKRYYIQSALAVPDSDKMSQETASFRRISDNFRKVLIVKSKSKPWYNEDGILILGLYDFLIDHNSLDQ